MENQTIQNPISEPVVPVAPVVESKRSFPVILVLLVILALLLIAFTAFLYYQNSQLKQQISDLNGKLSAISDNQPHIQVTGSTDSGQSPVANGMENWQTYTNSKYNFAFKYSNVLSSQTGLVSGSYTGTSTLIRTFSDPSSIRSGTDAPFDGFSLYVVTDLKASTFKDYMANELIAAQNSPYGNGKNITLNNDFAGSSIAISPNITLVYRPSSDEKTVVLFSESKVSDQDNFANMFDQILSTFKFTK